MDLAETLFYMMQKNQEAMQLTDLVTGTVTGVNPLEITINTAMAPLRAPVLLLTESVVEKKIPILSHSHTTSGFSHSHTINTLLHQHDYNDTPTTTGLSGSYATQNALTADAYTSNDKLTDIVCTEHGSALPVEDGYIILNRALAVGDKVLLLRVQHGQRFVVLSRIFA